MWLSIITFGTIVAFLIWTIQRKKLRHLFRIPLIVGLSSFLLISVYFSIVSEPTFLGGNSWYNQSPYRQIIFFALMLGGMGVRYITKAIEERREKIALLKKEKGKEKFEKPKIEFDIWEFSYPFFFSVITFGLLLKQIEINLITISNLILSFQTGFFWQTILKKEISQE